MEKISKKPFRTQSVFVRDGQELHRLNVSEIDYVRSDGNYCEIRVGGRKFVLKSSLTRLRQKLPAEQFVQIHRSYVVRIGAIESIVLSSNEVKIEGERLPVGRIFRDEFLRQINLLP